MYCYCKGLFNSNLKTGIHTLPVFADGVNHCETWLKMYTLTNGMTILVPYIISMINYGSKLIIRSLSKFEKH